MLGIIQKEIHFYQEMAPEHRSQENGKGLVPLNLYPDYKKIKKELVFLELCVCGVILKYLELTFSLKKKTLVK